MTDFRTDVQLWRGDVSSMLIDNPEQMAWVLIDALQRVNFEDLLEHVENHAGDEHELAPVIERLRKLANALVDLDAND